jgi:hypothetical protein
MAKKKNIRLRNNKGQFLSKAKEEIIRSIAKDEKVNAKNLALGKTKNKELNESINDLIFKNVEENNNINADRLFNKVFNNEINPNKLRLNGQKIDKKQFLFELKKLQNFITKKVNSPYFSIPNTIDVTDGVYNFTFPLIDQVSKKVKEIKKDNDGELDIDAIVDFFNEFGIELNPS